MSRFTDFMPAAYGRLYNGDEIAEHAAIAARRGGQLVHAEIWQSSKGPLLCVVAQDRPGLLAFITDALLAQGVTIQSAQAFCREVTREKAEAIDFLELRPSGAKGGPIQLDPDGLRAFIQFLTEVITDDMNQRAALSPSSSQSGAELPTRVYFERESFADGRYMLIVEAPDSNGLLHAVCSALSAKGMRIMACLINTVGGQANDRFELEPSSLSALSESELFDVQLAVLDALPSRH